MNEPIAPAPDATSEAPEAAVAPARFDTLPLDPKLLRAVADSGYQVMTPIQAKAIPVVLAGRDVMGAAQTGTGKTAAFSIPLLQKMLRHENPSMSPARHPVRALVLAPTRELADQVANNVKAYSKHTKLRAAVVFGGIDMKPQTLELKAGVEVLIATPGRLLDHIEAKNCVLNQVEYVVLDEADRMLDIGFLPDLQRILSYLPKQRQTLLFSATFSPEIKRLAESYLQDPLLVEVARPNATASTVEQRFYGVGTDDKRAAVLKLLKDRAITQAIVFVNSKLGCARLARSFERDGLRTNALHGDKSQDERLKALEAFKRGEVDVLVATDVAARGLDIADLPAVFNFDVPFNAEDYVHRIGRTGRAGASGLAMTLVTREDARLVGDIEKLIKKKIELEALDLDDAPARRERRRDDERPRRDDERRPAGVRDERPAAPPRAPARAAQDPFFERPYEAAADANPSWDRATAGGTGTAAATPSRSSLSPYIKQKKKVAALFGAKPPPAPAEAERPAPAPAATSDAG
ncbi:DEAD/DEAH box helicase [Piscinibacter sakaiensis]|uniref:DEAD-box ATP-dependent RNA helicase RhpA n=1 Tax=Piscinibacter sakaiensis TaxID=1547922 RepID=A0A0K8NT84_PISS1|nr:DEAD/DEAH box helicase [Piscinibacter sakaiensis]GAP33573.1 ATP-dependent RNA helicase Bcep18194_A5658 [Piscinibacter sakaiensis]